MFKIRDGALVPMGMALVSQLLLLAGCAGDELDLEDAPAELASLGQALSVRAAPELPSETLAVPEGNELAFYYDASGVQIYVCQALSTAAGYAWVFQAPEATLYGRRGRVTGQHYAGPTWEGLDHSKVVATKLAGFTADPSAIPALLLQAVSHEGEGTFSEVSFIQRLDTSGGLAPADGCSADRVGALARVDYSATYYFYEAARRRCGGPQH